jgi:hypothetical protein
MMRRVLAACWSGTGTGAGTGVSGRYGKGSTAYTAGRLVSALGWKRKEGDWGWLDTSESPAVLQYTVWGGHALESGMQWDDAV